MSLQKILEQSKAYNFTSSVEEKTYSKYKFNVYFYEFKIDNIQFQMEVKPNLWKWGKHYYDAVFARKGGSTEERIGKNVEFMNSVLKTISSCLQDFIEKQDKVKVISFEGDRVREKAYVRFFKNDPYFSKFRIDDSHEFTAFVDIYINKNT